MTDTHAPPRQDLEELRDRCITDRDAAIELALAARTAGDHDSWERHKAETHRLERQILELNDRLGRSDNYHEGQSGA
jgi:hypothetical protein